MIKGMDMDMADNTLLTPGVVVSTLLQWNSITIS